MSKHIEGPWGAHGGLVTDHNPERAGEIVAEVSLHGSDLDEMHARAALIAAAPEMLEALQGCYWFASLYTPDTDKWWAPSKKRILDVIAKAKGEWS